ncbi:Protein nedd1 [Dinochytrium kinnereticum]|nr:Protein nedd1 [Dinochytrium kinnereticum]
MRGGSPTEPFRPPIVNIEATKHTSPPTSVIPPPATATHGKNLTTATAVDGRSTANGDEKLNATTGGPITSSAKPSSGAPAKLVAWSESRRSASPPPTLTSKPLPHQHSGQNLTRMDALSSQEVPSNHHGGLVGGGATSSVSGSPPMRVGRKRGGGTGDGWSAGGGWEDEVRVGGVGGGGGGLQMRILEGVVEECLSEFRGDVREQIQDVHLEVLRQFHVQKTEIEALLQRYSPTAALLEEVRMLREENARLRCGVLGDREVGRVAEKEFGGRGIGGLGGVKEGVRESERFGV